MPTEDDSLKATNASERRVLLQVLGLNAALSAALFIAGIIGDSSGLLANALDNASDAGVYAIGLYAVGRNPKWKTRAAQASAVLLLLFAAGVIADAGRRWLQGAEPLGPMMIAMALLAAAVNGLCIKLLRSRHGDDVNMRAAWTFSLNDFYSNLGIVVAGGLVMALGRTWPDLVIGLVIAAIAIKGSIEIFRDAAGSPDRAPLSYEKSS